MFNSTSFKKKLRSYDWFGHTVTLNFNREGKTHNTTIGGFCSLILRIGVLIYLIFHINKLVNRTEDDIVFAIRRDDHIEMEEHTVKYSETSFSMFWILRTSDGIENPLWLDDEVQKYLKIEFVQ